MEALPNFSSALKMILPERPMGHVRFTTQIIGDGLSLFRELEEMKLKEW